MSNGWYYTDNDWDDAKGSLLWLHGAGGILSQWPAGLRRIQGWRVLAVDLPGHGRSLGHSLRRVEEYAEAVVSWIEGMGIKRLVVGGHSMGAAIAMQMAIDKGLPIDGLLLLGAGMRMPVNPNLLRQLSVWEHLPGTIQQIANWSFSRDAPERLRRKFAAQLATAGWQVLHDDFTACNQFDVSQHIGAVKLPVAVIAGEEDVMMPARYGEAIVAELVGGRVEMISGAGHMMMQEQARQVQAVVEAFLAELSGSKLDVLL